MKLSGKYGTWRGREFELLQTSPIDGLMILVQQGGESPGAEWERHEHGERFPQPRVSYTLGVPPEEVTNVHAVTATGELKSGLEVEIVAEDAEGKFEVVVGDEVPTERKWDLVEDHGFHTFHNEPVERSGVYGWLPAEMIHGLKSQVHWRKGDK